MDIFFIFLGLCGLVVGAELVIKGALRIAQYYGFSHTFVGLTVLALGTDLPELFVVLAGSLTHPTGGVSDVLVGEVVGSAMSQLMIVLGVLGFLRSTKVKSSTVARDGFVALFAVAMVFVFSTDGGLVAFEGWAMIVMYFVYLFWLYVQERGDYVKSVVVEKESVFWSLLFLFGGFGLLTGAAKITLDSALQLSQYFGIPEYIIGFYVIGLGTSLPELVTSFVALKRRASGMAVGNILGSNVLDLLFVLGVGATIAPLRVSSAVVFLDLPVLAFTTGFVVFYLLRTKKITKNMSLGLVLGYLCFSFLKFGLLL